jgi:hypothetical protein
MGGTGSGRKADVYSGIVEESSQLDVNTLVRDGIIGQGCHASGIISWTRFSGTSSIGFETDCYMLNGHITLNYRVSQLGKSDQIINYPIELCTTKPNYGGIRWWFICPNTDCNAMVGKLYQPLGGQYFLCRTCNNLTYASCRDSHKSDPFMEELAAETGLTVGQVKKVMRNQIIGTR